MATHTPSLSAIETELNAATAQLAKLAASTDDAAWSARPGDGQWSAGECVQHLNLTSRAYLPILTEALRDARSRGLTQAGDKNRLDFVGWLLWKTCGPPRKRLIKMKTMPPFVPAAIETRMQAVSDFESYQRRLVALLGDANGLALSKIRIQSPFNAKVRYNAYSAFRIVATHERRHIWQAEQARQARAVAP
jgi:hypothetical protein